jgi:hypothetical protein
MDEHMSIYNEVGGIRTLVLRNTTDEWDGLLMNEYAIVFDMFEWL